jgi:N4-gp56 family major capsid protein
MATMTYGDISPRTAAFVVRDLLERGMPWLIFEKFGQSKPLPANSTKSLAFRRYYLDGTFTTGAAATGIMSGEFNPYEYFKGDNFDPANKMLTEGITPDATSLESQDIDVSLTQYGDRVVISDVILDTHEDPILKEAVDILGEQAAILIEKTRYNVLKAGTTVFMTNNDTVRTNIDTVYSLLDQRKVTRFLKRQLGKQITSMVKSTPAYGTEPIAPSFIAICHPDLEPDLRAITGFVPVEKYGSVSPWENEIGKIEDVRYLATTLAEPWLGAGANGTAILETANLADVYPIIFLARDAYGIVAFKGQNSMIPMVVNPHASDSDPLAQRGHVGWKGYSATVILNDFWLVRVETACSDLTA